MATTQQRFSVIGDKNLNDLRKLINVPIEDSLDPWCYEASRDNIRHWAHGIGDDNPLWCDPAYAAKGPHGRLVAPPSFLLPTPARRPPVPAEWLPKALTRLTSGSATGAFPHLARWPTTCGKRFPQVSVTRSDRRNGNQP